MRSGWQSAHTAASSAVQRTALTVGARARSYEDNFDAVNNLFVIVKPAEKSKMEARQRGPALSAARCAHAASPCQDYGSPEQYLNTLAPLLGQQAWQGATESEGAQ